MPGRLTRKCKSTKIIIKLSLHFNAYGTFSQAHFTHYLLNESTLEDRQIKIFFFFAAREHGVLSWEIMISTTTREQSST